jgi:hypothetical protein
MKTADRMLEEGKIFADDVTPFMVEGVMRQKYTPVGCVMGLLMMLKTSIEATGDATEEFALRDFLVEVSVEYLQSKEPLD